MITHVYLDDQLVSATETVETMSTNEDGIARKGCAAQDSRKRLCPAADSVTPHSSVTKTIENWNILSDEIPRKRFAAPEFRKRLCTAAASVAPCCSVADISHPTLSLPNVVDCSKTA